MAVSTPFARSFFRQVWADAQASGLSLLDKLNALNAAAVLNAGTGKTIQSTSANGRSVSFAAPQSTTKAPSDGATPSDIVELMDRLFNLYDASVAAGNTTDPARYAYILTNLRAVRKVRNDYRLSRSSKLDLFPVYPFYR